MYWRFQEVAKTKKIQGFCKQKSPEMPNTSLEKLVTDKAGSSDRDIDWKALHHEVGQVGLGRWGHLCAQQFRCVKHTRKYQRWVMQRRMYSAANRLNQTTSSAVHHLGRVEGFTNARCNVHSNSFETSSSSSPSAMNYDSDCILDSSFDDTSMCIPLFSDDNDNGNDETVEDDSVTTPNSVSVEMSQHDDTCMGQQQKACARGCGNLSPAHAEDESNCVTSAQAQLESSICYRSTGMTAQKELDEEEKNIEKEVRNVLTYIVDEVSRKYIAHVVRNVLMSLVDDVCKGRITEYDRCSSSVTLPSHLYEHVADMAQAEVVLDPKDQALPMSASCLQHADPVSLHHPSLDDDTSSDASDLSSLFQESIDFLDAVIQEHDDDNDDTRESNRRRKSSVVSSSDCVKQYDRTYRNIKCSVSMDTVLRELERTRLDREQPDRVSSQTSSTDSGTVSIMYCKDLDGLELRNHELQEGTIGILGGSEGENEIPLKDFSKDEQCLSRPESTDTVPLEQNVAHMSFSSPTVMMSSPYVTSVTGQTEEDSDSEDVSSVTTSASEAVLLAKPCGDACESSFSDTTFFTTDEDMRDEFEIQELLNAEEWNQQIVEDPAGTPRNSSRSSSLATIASSIPSGNAMFLLDKSVTDSELGLEVIYLDDNLKDWQCNSFNGSLSEVSSLPLDTNPIDRERPQHGHHHCDTHDSASCEGPRVSPKKSWSSQGKGGCHVS